MGKFTFRISALVIYSLINLSSFLNGEVLVKGKDIIIGSEYNLNSVVLGEQRDLLIWLPESYKTGNQSYPVLYLLDGEVQFHNVSGIVEYLSKFRHIPEMIVVGVKNVDRERDFLPFQIDHWPPDPAAHTFRRFLRDELIPLIGETFRTSSYKILAGHSYGAIFSIDCFLKEPEIFTAYIIISPSLNWDEENLKKLWKEVLGHTLYYRKLLFLSISGDDIEAIRPTEEFVSILKKASPPGLEWRYDFMPDDDHLTVVHPVIFNALRWLHKGWRLPEKDMQQMKLEDVIRHYKNLSDRYGSEVKIPEGVLFNFGYMLFDAKKTGEAVEVYKFGTVLYPDGAAFYLGLGDIYSESGDLESAKENLEMAVQISEQKKDLIILPVARNMLKKLLKKMEK